MASNRKGELSIKFKMNRTFGTCGLTFSLLLTTVFLLGHAKTNTVKCIHVFVALCDNKYQGIVPVPASLGNGQNANSNLYWGSSFGLSAFFKKSKEWKLIKSQKLNNVILERLIFKNKTSNYYLVADAYDGRYIKQTTRNFLYACAGDKKDYLNLNGDKIGINSNAALLAYIGHDGLMDFKLENTFANNDGLQRDCIILACVSKKYFAPFVKAAKGNPIIWTSGLMCPEAYTLHDALSAYIKDQPIKVVKQKAVAAYNRYQKCGVAFADQLLVSGW